MRFFILLTTIFCLTLRPSSLEAQDETAMQLLDRVKTSIVDVRTEDTKTMTDANGHVIQGTYHQQGLGVVLDSYGTIVTNTHVVGNAPHIYVGLADGQILEAKLVYSAEADFSFIKVTPPYPLTPISWADSSQAPVGTNIIALSNDDSDQEHVMGGHITDLLNGMDSDNIEMLQLDLPLVHGDSGGPVLDSEGRLLGLIMGKKSSEDDKSYAIASNKIQNEYQNFQQNLPQ